MLCLHGSPLNCIKGINSALNISPDLTTKRFDTMEQLSHNKQQHAQAPFQAPLGTK